MTNNVNINGSNHTTRNCTTCNINGDNHGAITATGWITINGDNHGSLQSPQIEINGDNHGQIVETDIAEINGTNHSKVSAKKASLVINGGEVEVQQVSLRANIRGGRVIASEAITYAELKLSTKVLASMSVGQVTTHDFVVGIINGRRQTETVTLTRKGPNEWLVESQGITNQVTVLRDGRLLLEHRSGKLPTTIISGGGMTIINSGNVVGIIAGGVITGSSVTITGQGVQTNRFW